MSADGPYCTYTNGKASMNGILLSEFGRVKQFAVGYQHSVIVAENGSVVHCGKWYVIDYQPSPRIIFEQNNATNTSVRLIAAGYHASFMLLETTQQIVEPILITEFPNWAKAVIAITVILVICFAMFNGVFCWYQMYKRKKQRQNTLHVKFKDVEIEDTIPHFRLNESLFEIDEKDVTEMTEIGMGGSGNIIVKAKWKNQIIAMKLFR